MEPIFLQKKVLIAPLDWGLGHASRCIPLIKYLKQMGCEIVIASSGEQLKLLQNEFPELETILLNGYSINYSKHKRLFGAKILWQSPKILLRICQENRQLQNIIREHNIELVISDNRFGLYSKKIPCIFITHQLKIKAPYKWLENIIQKINYSFIEKFKECWVPDFEGPKNIAGELSHPEKLPAIPIKFLGALSRFQQQEAKELRYKYLFVLSGPEPQRSVFEEKVLDLAEKLAEKILIVRGKPGGTTLPKVTANYEVKNHLGSEKMQQVFLQSEYIVSRSGYTTVMELLSLQKKSILVPTPGQTEQEYLSDHLMQQHWCFCCKQDDDLLEQIKQAEKFIYEIPQLDEPAYKKVIDDFFDTSCNVS